jgi:FkbM family methyltransferase
MLSHRINTLGIWKRRLRVFGCIFRASTLDRLTSLWLHKVGVLGREEIAVLRQLVTDRMTVVDVGANQGLYTLFLAKLARGGKIIAFEPHPILYEQLVANVHENKIENIECHQAAVSDSSGALTLQLGSLHLGDNYIVTADAPSPVTTQVNAVTLDELFEKTTIDFLKIDIQGWEAAALAGGRNVLKNNRDIILFLEFWPFGLRRAGAKPDQLLSYLNELGFYLYNLKGSRLAKFQKTSLPDATRQFSYCNLVALRDPTRLPHALSEYLKSSSDVKITAL